MPYSTNTDLPPAVRRSLPAHAQDIYREAFNHAFSVHAGDPRQEQASHRIAWSGETFLCQGRKSMGRPRCPMLRCGGQA